MKKKFYLIFFLFIVSTLIFNTMIGIIESPVVKVETKENNTIDMNEYDLNDTILLLPNDVDFYPNQLFTVQNVNDSSFTPIKSSSNSQYKYGTYYYRLLGEPYQIYYICGHSFLYSMEISTKQDRFYSIGTVSSISSEFKPSQDYYTYPVIADENGNIEFTVTYSNFLTNEDSTKKIYISTIEVITKYLHIMDARCLFMIGFLLTGFIMFLYNGIDLKKKSYLYLSLLTLFILINNSVLYYRILMVGRLDFTFSISIINYIKYSIPTICLLTFLNYFNEDFLIKFQKLIIFNYFFQIVVFLLSPLSLKIILTMIFKYFNYSLFIIFYLIKFSKFNILKKVDQFIFFGFCLFIITEIIDALVYTEIEQVFPNGLSLYGLLILDLCFLVHFFINNEEKLEQFIKREIMISNKESQQKMRKSFFNNISHELKTPLTVINGYAQSLSIKLSKNESVNKNVIEKLDIISKESLRLGSLINAMSTVNSFKESQLEISPILLSDMREKIENIAESILEKNNNHLKIIVPSKLPRVYGNEAMFMQIFFNLLANSNRHTKNDTIILKGEFSQIPGFINLFMEDHGEGIPPEILNNIFDEGRSGDGSTGLGLPICKEMAIILKGSISIESEVNKGTTVNLQLRIYSD